MPKVAADRFIITVYQFIVRTNIRLDIGFVAIFILAQHLSIRLDTKRSVRMNFTMHYLHNFHWRGKFY